MSEMSTTRSRGYIDRPSSSSLADVINIILDKGLVIDAFVRISVVGIELITIDARIVIASVDTYLRFAEATNRLDLMETGGRDLTELTGDMMEGGSRGKTKGVMEGVKETLVGDDDSDDDTEEKPRPKRKSSSSSSQERPRRRPARKE